MNNEFQNLLTKLLNEYQECGDANSVIKNAQLTAEDKELLDNVNSILDSFDKKAVSLQAARENGYTRNEWMAEQLEEITEKCSEEEKTLLINEISKASEECIESTLTQK